MSSEDVRETRFVIAVNTPKPPSLASGETNTFPAGHTPNTSTEGPVVDIHATLFPDDINFPRLPSATRRPTSPPRRADSPPVPDLQTPQTAKKTPIFIWRNKPPNEEIQQVA